MVVFFDVLVYDEIMKLQCLKKYRRDEFLSYCIRRKRGRIIMIAKDLLEKLEITGSLGADFDKYNSLVGKECEKYADSYMKDEIDDYEAQKLLDALETEEISKYTLYLIFLLHSTAALLENYKKEGISEEIFYASMMDFKYKIRECREVEGVFGIKSYMWYNGFFKELRHAFGRLQFDRIKHEGEPIERAGHIVFEGDFVLNCHIPSAGPLLHEDCIESYKMAYKFFKDKLIDGILPIVCWSWLLYPKYRDVFGINSNVCRFAADYRIFKEEDTDVFGDCWRVFGRDYEGDISVLPENTSMQRAFKAYIKNNGTYGHARGILLFDGDKVLTKNQYLLDIM